MECSQKGRYEASFKNKEYSQESFLKETAQDNFMFSWDTTYF